MANNLSKRLPLLGRRSFVEGHLSPVHLALREIASEIAIDPEFGAREIDGSIVSAIYFVCVIEFAEVLGFSTFVVSRRTRVEIAHAEMWTAACLYGGCVNGPVCRWRG